MTGLRLSVLDQSPVTAGSTSADALHCSVDLARLADAVSRAQGERDHLNQEQADALAAWTERHAAEQSARAG